MKASNQVKFLDLEDWKAVKAAGGDPGKRPPSGARDREIDPAQRLLADSTPKVVPITPSQLEAGAAARRRRNADRLLEKYGLKPRRWV